LKKRVTTKTMSVSAVNNVVVVAPVRNAGPTIMVSGPTIISKTLFDRHYAPAIKIHASAGCGFVLGGESGVDWFAQELLYELGAKDVTIFDMGDQNNCRHRDVFKQQNGFATSSARDCHMTFASHIDIAFIFKDGGGSDTMQNIFRREYGHITATRMTKLIRSHSKLEE
jgi:hypothetical protein